MLYNFCFLPKAKKGILLGIVGSDVPITELTKLAEQYMVSCIIN